MTIRKSEKLKSINDFVVLEKETLIDWLKRYCVIIPNANWYSRDNDISLTKDVSYKVIDVNNEGCTVKDNEDIKEIITYKEIRENKFKVINVFTGQEIKMK